MAPVADDDWRLRGQEKHLAGATLYWRTWTQTRERWDHDHCDFCGVKFMIPHPKMNMQETILVEGWCTDDEYYWICDQCFVDFKDRFAFLVGRPKTE